MGLAFVTQPSGYVKLRRRAWGWFYPTGLGWLLHNLAVPLLQNATSGFVHSYRTWVEIVGAQQAGVTQRTAQSRGSTAVCPLCWREAGGGYRWVSLPERGWLSHSRTFHQHKRSALGESALSNHFKRVRGTHSAHFFS